MEIKQNLKYLESHEWADVNGNKVKVGITDFAQIELGDIVFVELPSVGEKVVKRGIRKSGFARRKPRYRQSCCCQRRA